jgi:hypothetical protein
LEVIVIDRGSKGMDRAREMREWRDRRAGVRERRTDGEERSRLGDYLEEWGREQRQRALSERTI